MSSYHVLDLPDEDTATVVFHIAVPAEVNAAGKPLQDAVKEWLTRNNGGAPITSEVPWLAVSNPGELADISNGVIFEHIETVRFDAHGTIPQKRAALDAQYTRLAARIPDFLRSRLRFWGLDRTVV